MQIARPTVADVVTYLGNAHVTRADSTVEDVPVTIREHRGDDGWWQSIEPPIELREGDSCSVFRYATT